GSKDIVVENAFVPEHRSQSHLDYTFNQPLPGHRENDGALYRMPWSVVFNMALAASILGSARGFVDLWIKENATRRLGPHRAADDALLQHRLADATWYIDATMTRMRADAIELGEMAQARQPETMAQRARMRWNMNRGCDLVADAIVGLMRSASGRTIYVDQPLQQRFQDLQGGLGHAYLVPDPLARYVGGALLGSEKLEMVL